MPNPTTHSSSSSRIEQFANLEFVTMSTACIFTSMWCQTCVQVRKRVSTLMFQRCQTMSSRLSLHQQCVGVNNHVSESAKIAFQLMIVDPASLRSSHIPLHVMRIVHSCGYFNGHDDTTSFASHPQWWSSSVAVLHPSLTVCRILRAFTWCAGACRPLQARK
jgi:hypothetical protein